MPSRPQRKGQERVPSLVNGDDDDDEDDDDKNTDPRRGFELYASFQRKASMLSARQNAQSQDEEEEAEEHHQQQHQQQQHFQRRQHHKWQQQGHPTTIPPSTMPTAPASQLLSRRWDSADGVGDSDIQSATNDGRCCDSIRLTLSLQLPSATTAASPSDQVQQPKLRELVEEAGLLHYLTRQHQKLDGTPQRGGDNDDCATAATDAAAARGFGNNQPPISSVVDWTLLNALDDVLSYDSTSSDEGDNSDASHEQERHQNMNQDSAVSFYLDDDVGLADMDDGVDAQSANTHRRFSFASHDAATPAMHNRKTLIAAVTPAAPLEAAAVPSSSSIRTASSGEGNHYTSSSTTTSYSSSSSNDWTKIHGAAYPDEAPIIPVDQCFQFTPGQLPPVLQPPPPPPYEKTQAMNNTVDINNGAFASFDFAKFSPPPTDVLEPSRLNRGTVSEMWVHDKFEMVEQQPLNGTSQPPRHDTEDVNSVIHSRRIVCDGVYEDCNDCDDDRRPPSIREMRIGMNHDWGGDSTQSSKKMTNTITPAQSRVRRDSSVNEDDSIYESSHIPLSIRRLDSVLTYQTMVSELTVPPSINNLKIDHRAPQYRLAMEQQHPQQSQQVRVDQTLLDQPQQKQRKDSRTEMGADSTIRACNQRMEISSDRESMTSSRKDDKDNQSYTQNIISGITLRQGTLLEKRAGHSIINCASTNLYAEPPARPPPSPSSETTSTFHLLGTPKRPYLQEQQSLSSKSVEDPIIRQQTPLLSLPSTIVQPKPRQLSALTNPYYGDEYSQLNHLQQNVQCMLGGYGDGVNCLEDDGHGDELLMNQSFAGKWHLETQAASYFVRTNSSTTFEPQNSLIDDGNRQGDDFNPWISPQLCVVATVTNCTATHGSIDSQNLLDGSRDDKISCPPPLIHQHVARRGTIGCDAASAKPPIPKMRLNSHNSPIRQTLIEKKEQILPNQQHVQLQRPFVTPSRVKGCTALGSTTQSYGSNPQLLTTDFSSEFDPTTAKQSSPSSAEASIDSEVGLGFDVDNESTEKTSVVKVGSVLGPFGTPNSVPRQFRPAPGTPLKDSNPLLYPQGLSFKPPQSLVQLNPDTTTDNGTNGHRTSAKPEGFISTIPRNENLETQEIDLSTHDLPLRNPNIDSIDMTTNDVLPAQNPQNQEIDLSTHDPELHDIDLSQHSPSNILAHDNEPDSNHDIATTCPDGGIEQLRIVSTIGPAPRKGKRMSAKKHSKHPSKSPPKAGHPKKLATQACSNNNRLLSQAPPWESTAAQSEGSGSTTTTSSGGVLSSQPSPSNPSVSRLAVNHADDDGNYFDLVIDDGSDAVDLSEIGMESTVYTEEYESESESYDEEESGNDVNDESQGGLEEIIEEEEISFHSSSSSSLSDQEEYVELNDVKEEYKVINDADEAPGSVPRRVMSHPTPTASQTERRWQLPASRNGKLTPTSATPSLKSLISISSTTSTVVTAAIRRIKMAPMEVVYVCDGEEVVFSGFYSGPIDGEGKMNGSGVFWFNTGDLYLGQFNNGNLHGCGALSIMVEEEWDETTGEVLEWSREILKGYFRWNQYVGSDPHEGTC